MHSQKIEIPYGKSSKSIDVPNDRLQAVLCANPKEENAAVSQEELVLRALENPIDSPRLRELARGKRKIVVITSDHTRPLPSHITMPILLEEIRSGNPQAEITILIATGMHRGTDLDEMRLRFGEEICSRERIVVHDAHDEANLALLGTTPSGLNVAINKLGVECDLLVAEGFIEPHFFAGFSGGRKAVMPGIAGYRTVLENHCAELIADDNARAGVLENNPIHEEMLAAARMAGLAFILNVTLDRAKRIDAAFAGNMDTAHKRGCAFCSAAAGVKAPLADIVVTGNGGYPLDQNLYQTVKCMSTAQAVLKPGGMIVVVAECRDGHGGEAFYETFANISTPEGVLRDIRSRKRGETLPDQWQIQIFVQILAKHRVVMVTSLEPEMIEHLGITPASSIEEAITIAENILGKKDASITVIPDGVSVIVQ